LLAGGMNRIAKNNNIITVPGITARGVLMIIKQV
jgi:hypothetical protein